MPDTLTASDLLERAEAVAPRYGVEVSSIRRVTTEDGPRLAVVCRGPHSTAADLMREALSVLSQDTIAVIFQRDAAAVVKKPARRGEWRKGTGRLEDVAIRPLPTDEECAALGREVCERLMALASDLWTNALRAPSRVHLERQAERHGCANGLDFFFRYLVRSAREGDVYERTEDASVHALAA